MTNFRKSEKRTWRYKVRPITVGGLFATIPLTRGKSAIIDAADVPLVEAWNWSAKPGPKGLWYAVRTGNRPLSLHQLILGIKTRNIAKALSRQCRQVIDHIDGNGLNCCRSNLRFVSDKQNKMNQRVRCDSASRFKGVRPRGARWGARICYGGKRHSLGTFATEQEAAVAYNHAAKLYFGEYAFLNKIDEFGEGGMAANGPPPRHP